MGTTNRDDGENFTGMIATKNEETEEAKTKKTKKKRSE